MSVAQLWQGANIISWNKKTYPSAASGVSGNTFDLYVQSVVCLLEMDFARNLWKVVLMGYLSSGKDPIIIFLLT